MIVVICGNDLPASGIPRAERKLEEAVQTVDEKSAEHNITFVYFNDVVFSGIIRRVLKRVADSGGYEFKIKSLPVLKEEDGASAFDNRIKKAVYRADIIITYTPQEGPSDYLRKVMLAHALNRKASCGSPEIIYI